MRKATEGEKSTKCDTKQDSAFEKWGDRFQTTGELLMILGKIIF